MFINKLLPYLFFPLTWVIVLLGFAFIAILFHKRGRALTFLALATSTLWLISCPRPAYWLVSTIESQYPPMPIENLPTADAIVLLTGGVVAPLKPRLYPELNDSGDRLAMAAALFHAGKAPYILVSGGQVFPNPELLSEAEYHVEFLRRLNVPNDAIVLEIESRNTAENALFSEDILVARGDNRILLVTSAFHMPRSMLLFEQTGLIVVAVSTDFRSPLPVRPEILYWLPDGDALAYTQMAIREHLGYWVYKVKAYLFT
jgi:uncharacterized SAM-binding protein YcdF (DUF218 family)